MKKIIRSRTKNESISIIILLITLIFLFPIPSHSHEIKKDDNLIVNDNVELNFFNQVVFVAIKNGMHDSKGYVFCSPNSNFKTPKEPAHVSKLYDIILSYF